MKDLSLQEWREKLLQDYQNNSPKNHAEPVDDWVYLIHEADLHRAYGRIMETVELLGIEREDILKKGISRAFWNMGGEQKSVIHQKTLDEVMKVVPIPTFIHDIS